MNDWLPMDDEQTALQVKVLLGLLGDSPLDVVDVGCGNGRLLIPIAVAGHNVVGIDVDPNAISGCAAQCVEADVDAELIDGSLFDVLPLSRKVDAIVCCGQTFMLLHDVDEAVKAMRLFRESLREGGVVVLDDIPNDLWPEVANGNWANGVNDEGTLQLVWAENDVVFAIREGDNVDEDSWGLKGNDTPVRLWTMGSLRLAARAADLSAPEVPVKGAILVMRAV
jgi:SAM-dependent methyltransferase